MQHLPLFNKFFSHALVFETSQNLKQQDTVALYGRFYWLFRVKTYS